MPARWEHEQMMRYQVVDLSVDGHRVLLRDADLQLHVMHHQGHPLVREQVLSGRRAKLGAHVLIALDRGRPLLATFDSVACSQGDALALLHPVAERSARA